MVNKTSISNKDRSVVLLVYPLSSGFNMTQHATVFLIIFENITLKHNWSFLLFSYSCLAFSSIALPCPIPSHTSTVNPPHCLWPWVFYWCSLACPFPYFPHYPPPPTFWSLVSLFFTSMSLVLFGSFVKHNWSWLMIFFGATLNPTHIWANIKTWWLWVRMEKKYISHAPTILFLAKIHPREMKVCVQKMNTWNICGSLICNSLKLETTQSSSKGKWINIRWDVHTLEQFSTKTTDASSQPILGECRMCSKPALTQLPERFRQHLVTVT